MYAGDGFAAAISNTVNRFRLACAAGVLAVVVFATPALAADYMYWSQNGLGNYVARANIDGTGINTSFLTDSTTVGGIAFDSTHIYWAGPNGVSRANIDGTGKTQIFSGLVAPGIAVDGQYVYAFVPNVGGSGGNIVRMNLDGTGLNSTFVPVATDAFYLAVDNAHIYWVDGMTNKIGRANIDGSGANASFISTSAGAQGIAVNRSYIYWALGSPTNAIARANLDGTGASDSFMTSVSNPRAIAVDSNYLYWSSNGAPRNIGRANLDGSLPNANFVVTGATGSLYGIAVSPAGGIVNYALSVTKAGTGAGTVSSSPAGIDCGPTCSADYASGTSVTLTAAPASGSTFSSWSGACSGTTATCTVSMSQAQSVTATFNPVPVPSNTFTVRTPLVVGTAIRTLVAVPGPGVIRQTGTFRLGGKVRPACTAAARTASAAGIYRMRCRTYDVARAARKKGPVRILVTTTYRPTGGTARAVLRTVVLRSLRPRFTG